MSVLPPVHQFHSGTAVGDAITNQMFELRAELRALGHPSEIFAEHRPRALVSEVHSIDDYVGAADQVLFVHHSMGYDAFERIVSLPDRLAVVYHNITPAHFFVDETLQRYSRLGRTQLRRLAARAHFGLADSNFNRKEMLEVGFDRVHVLPVRLDFDAFRGLRDGASIDPPSWLYVGRLVPNKRQSELVTAFAEYRRRFAPDARLVLVGDRGYAPYVADIEATARSFGVEDAIVMTGKVDDAGLRAAYAAATVYVSLSEHEGFGVPLLEAMSAGVPVVALDSSAVLETMGGGMVVREKSPSLVAGLVHLLHTDDGLRLRLLEHQKRRLDRLARFDRRAVLAGVVRECLTGRTTPRTVQVQGPFETSYSLAVLNRELALHLDEAGVDVSIHATEGPGDYDPAPADLARHPAATRLYERSGAVPYPDVVIRQMYPPRVADSPGGITLQYFGWEESRLPADIVASFNRHLDGIGTMSTYVRELLVESGVTVPIHVVGVGVVRPDTEGTCDRPELAGLRSVRFVHISSAFPRKGVDVLLDAYFAAFSGDDDVSLVLKTYPNPHNEVERLLAERRAATANPPDVRWIDGDLGPSELGALYGLATCYVHPARGEGFGLPVAEAMLAGVPVIAPASTGLADLVSPEWAITVPFREEPARTHLSVEGSTWMEPDGDALASALRRVADDPHHPELAGMAERARHHIERHFSWAEVARKWLDVIAAIETSRTLPRVAMVSTWNSKCGIAENTRYILEHVGRRVDAVVLAERGVEPVDPVVEQSTTRVWTNGWEDDLSDLLPAIAASAADIVHVQHNFGFFSPESFRSLLDQLVASHPVVVSLHRTAPLVRDGLALVDLADLATTLRQVDRIIVHQTGDAVYLDGLGVSDNVEVVPLGTTRAPASTPAVVKSMMRLHRGPLVGSFGFLLPHKGTLELLRVVDRLRARHPDIRALLLCARHPDPSSAEYEQTCRRFIDDRGLGDHVLLVTDFLDDATAKMLLRACDAIVLPYAATEESSSATLRFVLAAERPIVASDLALFADAREALALVPPGDEEALVQRLDEVLRDPDVAERLARAAADARASFDWDVVADRHVAIYRDVLARRGEGAAASPR